MDISLIRKRLFPRLSKPAKVCFWFFVGAVLGLFLFVSFAFIIFENVYKNAVYPGVLIGGVDFGGKSEKQVEDFFLKKNERIGNTKFVFKSDYGAATISAKELNFGYDEKLLATQAISIGRSSNALSNMSLIAQAYINTVVLLPSYHYSQEKLLNILSPVMGRARINPVDALFTFQNGRVTTFIPSRDGQAVDREMLESELASKLPFILSSDKPETLFFNIPIRIIKSKLTTDKVNNLGIKELIASGSSLFQDSIPSRVYNITLSASRLNGILVPPGQVFSFDKALGDVSSLTGYKQAYIIQGGRTVLGDGGGVCQVSTTFFRALLAAGLPIVERHAHSYRVGYYEEDSPPGLDATVYVPTVDLKFKNDTGNYILIQSSIDPSIERLTFYLYGTKDGRAVTLTKPVVTDQTPPPPAKYEDDPTLPKGEIKQVDFAAWGAHVYFTRTVEKGGKVIIYDKFFSNYQPWQAVFLRGTNG